MSRDTAVQAFLQSVRDVLAAREAGAEATAAVDRIYAALASPGRPGPNRARRLPVCDAWLPEALETARTHSPDVARIADAVAAVEPALAWTARSAGGPHASSNWRRVTQTR